MEKKKRIAIIFMGGSLSSFHDRNSKAIFKIHAKKEIAPLLSSLDDDYDLTIISDLISREEFLKLPDWEILYRIIQKKYSKFDGFVIVQETDSILFGSSLFSYLFSECRKPIVFTCSPLPLGDPAMDNVSQNNVLGAVRFAGEDLGEVCIYADNKVHRALRAKRQNIMDDSPFYSYQADVLGEMIDGMPHLYLHRMRRENSVEKYPFTFPSEELLFLRISPMTHLPYLSQIVDDLKVSGVVIESLGYGTIPDSLVHTLRDLSHQGIRIVLIAEHDSHERKVSLGGDILNIKNCSILKNTTIWGSYAKAHIALENTDSPEAFFSFVSTPYIGDTIE